MTLTNYGCHNRPTLRQPVPVQDGWFLDGVTRTPKLVAWVNPMSTDCKLDTRATDPRCAGCKLAQGDKAQSMGVAP